MKSYNLFTIAILLMISGFVFQACGSGCTCGLTAEDETFFKSSIAASADVWNNGDRTGYGDRYADDAIFMAPNAAALNGKTAINAFLAGFPDVKATFTPEEIMGSCQLAVVRGAYVLTLPDGSPFDNGKWVEVWQKSEDGTWLLTRDIFNSDQPLPEAATDESEMEE